MSWTVLLGKPSLCLNLNNVPRGTHEHQHSAGWKGPRLRYAPLGNMFRDIPEAEAQATRGRGLGTGTRYFDTAPFYGAGLAEIRLGDALAKRNRDDFVLSTKVGRLILDEVEDTSARDLGEKGGLFVAGRPNKLVNDYSADATLRSIDDSLTRLKTDRLDIVLGARHRPGFLRR